MGKSKEWTRFSKEVFQVDDWLLKPDKDATGNGDCFFHSLKMCGVFRKPIESFREDLWRFCWKTGKTLFAKACKIFADNGMTNAKVLKTIKTPQVYVGTIASIMIAKMLKVRIRVIILTKSGYELSEDNFKNLQMLGQETDSCSTKDVFLLFHHFELPMTFSQDRNHFCPLHLQNIEDDLVEKLEDKKELEELQMTSDSEMSELKEIVVSESDEAWVGNDENESQSDEAIESPKPPPKKKQKQMTLSQIRKKRVKDDKSAAAADMKRKTSELIASMRDENIKVESKEVTLYAIDHAAEILGIESVVFDEELQASSLCLDDVIRDVEKLNQTEKRKSFLVQLKSHPTPQRSQDHSKTWFARSFRIFAYLHPKLLNKNKERYVKVFKERSHKTLNGWLGKKDMIARWLPIVAEMTYGDLVTGSHIPFKVSVEIPLDSKVNLTAFVEKAGLSLKEYLIHGTRGYSGKKISVASKRSKSIEHIQRKTKRVSPLRRNAHHDEFEFLIRTVEMSVETGNPMSKSEIKDALESRFASTGSSFAKNKFNNGNRGDCSLRNWIKRTLAKEGYSNRLATVSQTLPENFIDVAKKFKNEFDQWYGELEPDFLVASDETFLLFHHPDDSVIAKVGSRKVPKGIKVKNKKAGVTLMVSAELMTGQLLEPLVIMDGGWGKKLMKEYETYEGATVLFNNNHWMSGNAFKFYLETLYRKYRGSVIGLVVDHFSGHISDDVMAFIEKRNEEDRTTKLEMKIIPKGMTSVLQVCDVGINHQLKERVRKGYHEIEKRMKRRVDFVPGATLTLERRQFLDLVCQSFDELNATQPRNWIKHLFQKCGQDPKGGQLSEREFLKHLEQCSEDRNDLEKPQTMMPLE